MSLLVGKPSSSLQTERLSQTIQGNSVPLECPTSIIQLFCHSCHHLHQFKDHGEKVQLMYNGGVTLVDS